MTWSHFRMKSAIRRHERKLHKHLRWEIEQAEENHAWRRAYFKEAKIHWVEQGGASFAHCRDWVRFGDAIGPPP